MRENGWLEAEFRAASQRVSEWPDWKKEIEAKKTATEDGETPAPPQVAKAVAASSKE